MSFINIAVEQLKLQLSIQCQNLDQEGWFTEKGVEFWLGTRYCDHSEWIELQIGLGEIHEEIAAEIMATALTLNASVFNKMALPVHLGMIGRPQKLIAVVRLGSQCPEVHEVIDLVRHVSHLHAGSATQNV